jgi:cyclophilin family peptidyl-prolyl cis-trans isomerase
VKLYFYASLMVMLVACAQHTETTTQSDTSSTTVTSATNDTTATTSTTVTTVTESTAAAAPAPPAAQEKKMTDTQAAQVAEIHTSEGDITIRFFPDVAPNHVKNFTDLAQKGFYNGTKFHRVIPGFMVQGGDPNTKTDETSSWGTGGSGKNVAAEFSTVSHKRGIVSMARSSDPNSASSQFFIVVKDSPFLDRQYTVFGQVTSGMDVADKIVNAPRDQSNDRPYKPVSIKSITFRAAKDSEKGPAPK